MNLDSERQAFESAWDKRQRADWARGGRDPDQYPIGWGLAFKLTGWEMWQARAALQAPQEPVLHVNKDDLAALSVRGFLRSANDCATSYFDVPLFANPPSPTPLTDKQIACVLEPIADDNLIVLCPKTIIYVGRLLIAKSRGQP